MIRVVHALASISAAAIVAGCSSPPRGGSLPSSSDVHNSLSISHFTDGAGAHRSVAIETPGGPITVDESVSQGPSGKMIVDTMTIGGKAVSVTYDQDEARNQTIVKYPSESGEQTRTLPGLVGQVSDERLAADVKTAVGRHTDSARHTQAFNMGYASQVCATACLEFLLLDGIGYLVCYGGCLAAWTASN